MSINLTSDYRYRNLDSCLFFLQDISCLHQLGRAIFVKIHFVRALLQKVT